ncbi:MULTISPECIES: FlgO family outer membrane protein [Pseudoalteromonas]|uniref:Flagellar biosynthesis protein FlgO n=1 Tax=Pseudoalteromonas amylolytica TaxID=1859457 RepID=A0A1S1MTW5_9GAMM|nr:MULTISPECIES: FlgO family outer membrane protein [Pseudoalteromonas]MCF6434653.1 flagellar biosynthesis protein FlgO [Pseudoalteromonas sp. MMG022]OHU87529.1 flagellar biosynthesis protein FlgO [Pseudoalteromonas sp. JW3]OHU90972.1 flagellar biosynthesis protein FlgO [Pseudoalteromonas amylolytica]
MKQRIYLLSTLVLALSGCQLLIPTKIYVEEERTAHNQSSNAQTKQQLIEDELADEFSALQNTRRFNPSQHHLRLANYVEQMALDLVDTMNSEQDISIAVASFVDFDNNLRTTNQLGNQLAETFIHQLQKFGYGVVDFKTANSVSVTSSGDFSFSREVKALTNQRIASHILSGTMIYRSMGVEVNARVIDIDSKQVIATSTKLLPHYVLQSANIVLSSVN